MSDNTLEISQAVNDATRAARETVARLTMENADLARENYRLRRALGMRRLWADLMADVAEKRAVEGLRS